MAPVLADPALYLFTGGDPPSAGGARRALRAAGARPVGRRARALAQLDRPRARRRRRRRLRAGDGRARERRDRGRLGRRHRVPGPRLRARGGRRDGRVAPRARRKRDGVRPPRTMRRRSPSRGRPASSRPRSSATGRCAGPASSERSRGGEDLFASASASSEIGCPWPSRTIRASCSAGSSRPVSSQWTLTPSFGASLRSAFTDGRRKPASMRLMYAYETPGRDSSRCESPSSRRRVRIRSPTGLGAISTI